MSDEAEKAAQSVVEAAHRQLERISTADADDARKVVADAEKAAAVPVTKPRKVTSKVPKQRASNQPYKTRTKAELLELAASKGIEGRSAMNKADLVKALTRAAR